jgi:hypothetical protein
MIYSLDLHISYLLLLDTMGRKWKSAKDTDNSNRWMLLQVHRYCGKRASFIRHPALHTPFKFPISTENAT